jgi:hypothetical protein
MWGLLVAIVIILIAAKFMFGQRIYWFHLNTCPHCVAMKDEWAKFESMCMFSLIRPISIESSLPQNQEITETYGVTGFPTIVKDLGDDYQVYNGPRTAEAIYKWAQE